MQATAEDMRPGESEGESTVWRLPNTEWLTAAEAARYAGGIGVSTIREACNRNKLRHIRIGGRTRGPIRTRSEWITEWLERWARGGEPMRQKGEGSRGDLQAV
jgi:hypothetical protein